MVNGPFGMNTGLTHADATGPKFDLGSYGWNEKGLWQYGHAAGAIAQYAAVKIDNDGEISELTTTITGTEPTAVGAAQVAFADNDYGWVFRGFGGGAGNGIKIKLAASCVQDVQLFTTGTAGVLDDAATDLIQNVTLVTTITSATAAEVYCIEAMKFVGG